jgi:ribonuclease HI
MAEALKVVNIYTDGGCARNPGGPGGYGAILVHGETRRELSGGFRGSTNNRMELMAAIAGLEALKAPCVVTVCSDSQYVVNGMAKGWAENWRRKGWRMPGPDGGTRPNVDLWQRLLGLCRTHQVTFAWVRGHNGHPENERCDVLAGEAMRKADLPPDEGYEASLTPSARG